MNNPKNIWQASGLLQLLGIFLMFSLGSVAARA
jgi:hypothetical protein